MDEEAPLQKERPERTGFYTLEPDFARPRYRLPENIRGGLWEKFFFLYGEEKAQLWFGELERIIAVNHAHKTDAMLEWEKDFRPEERFSQRDVILITYGDLVIEKGKKPIQTLKELCSRYLKGVFSTIHLLPFFPSSSDRGFAIRDFRQVDPSLGTWDDVMSLKEEFKLMFDGVINHVSSKSFWFQEYLNGNPDYSDYFTAFSTEETIPREKLKMLFRPRTTDVLTPFHSYEKPVMVWTTFSPDQIDLNFQNPKVLIRIIEILLYYVRRGADIIRLDAVTYLWDEVGTTGVHLRQTHTIVKMFRQILDAVAPHVAVITETNVPHKDNISYFGNGSDEAQMVYNFALPPLILHTFQTGDAGRLSDWAKSIKNPSPTATFFNFLDSHDGIGVMGARGILTDDEINAMAKRVIEHGGMVSYRREPDGTDSVYELNITSYSALNRDDIDEDVELQVKRYLAARSIPLVLIGVPGIYLHGLLGSKNDIEAVKAENDKRSINRDVIRRDELVSALEDMKSTTSRVAQGIVFLISMRRQHHAFNPRSKQVILDCGRAVFGIMRKAVKGSEIILALVNVTGQEVSVSLDLSLYDEIPGADKETEWYDILGGGRYMVEKGCIECDMKPYDIAWLKNDG